MSWQPILEGELAEQARGAVLDVARALADGAGDDRRPADLTLFWAYFAGWRDDEWSAEHYDRATEALCASIGDQHHLALYGGVSGVAWTLAHVCDEGAAEEVLAPVDAALRKALAVETWRGQYDLISGWVGIAVYLLERLAAGGGDDARQALVRVVDHAVASAETSGGGRAWYTPAEQLPPHQRVGWPDGYFNCGMAHGVPGVVGILARIGDADPRARALCLDACRWLEERELAPGPRSRYPTSVGRALEEAPPGRTAWCYGDPGVVAALWDAAARLGTPADHAIELARAVAAREPAVCGVIDAGLCHGSAGLAHLYNRWFHASGDPEFRDAARRWFQHALDHRRPEGIGGFSSWIDRGAGGTWTPSASFLEGGIGVALALLAALTPTEPRWDRMLLVDLPVAP